MVKFEMTISQYSMRNETLTDCAARWRTLDIWKLALQEAGHQSFPTAIWNENAHFYDPVAFVADEESTSVHLTADAFSGKVILVVDERLRKGPIPCTRNRFPRDPELKKLTRDLPCIVKLPEVHCEVYPSRPINENWQIVNKTNPRQVMETVSRASVSFSRWMTVVLSCS
jgi:hypothetical protein